MAGLGYKDFTAGAVLTAAQVDGYLMEQSVMNFAGTAARGSALASVLSAGQVAHVGGGTLTVYDGSNWQQFAPIGAANRNILFNGAMQVSQRGTSTASITTSGYYTADRWRTLVGTLGTWTQSVENDAPTGSGLSKSVKMLVTTGASPSSNSYVVFQQLLEGQDLQRTAKGTADAKQLTLSFWVKSNVTGTYNVELEAGSRHICATYLISASATWEKKTITFAGDTTSAFPNDNTGALSVTWGLGYGSNFTSGTLATSWASRVAANVAPGITNTLPNTTNNYWQVTGVQLETGSQATAFEFKSFGQELRECQRYYQKSYDVTVAPRSNASGGRVYWYLGPTNSANKGSTTWLKVSMRAGPTVTIYRESDGASGIFNSGETAIVITQGTNSFTAYAASSAAGEVAGHYVAEIEL